MPNGGTNFPERLTTLFRWKSHKLPLAEIERHGHKYENASPTDSEKWNGSCAGRILDEAEKMLTPIEVTIMEKRYRLGIRWEHVAASINYSLRRTLEIHKEILKKVSSL